MSKYQNLKDFLTEQNILDFNIKSVDINFISNYDIWLTNKDEINSKNYKARCLQSLVRVISFAVFKGYLKQNILKYYNIEKAPSKEPEYITHKELLIFQSFKFVSPTLQRVADTFILQCCTSLDYADLVTFNKKKHLKNIEGMLWIIKKREKAAKGSERQITKIPLLPQTFNIFEKYNWKIPLWNNVRCKNMSYDKYRTYLKQCASILNININVVTKTGRRTFINLMHEKGVPVDDITAMVGHNKTSTTQNFYLRFSTKRIRMTIEKVFGKDFMAG